MSINGFFNIDKPQGMTSTDVVRRVRRLARQKRVGHGGTLDPMATGVLPIALGQATRLLEYLQEEADKAYRATVQLGITTDSDDAEGTIIERQAVPTLNINSIEQVLAHFRGTIEQTPPQFSAIRIAGKRMYEHARAGDVIEIPTRTVTIKRLELCEWTADTLVLAVACSKGTYIRSLARDIGAMLGCGAHLTALRRTQAGMFDLSSAVVLEALDDPAVFAQMLLPPTAAIADWHIIHADAAMTTELRHGRVIERTSSDQRAAVVDEHQAIVAIVQAADTLWQPIKVFAAE